jgi:GntR family transcriptional regulator
MNINKNSSTPAYQQIEDLVRQKIEGGELQPEDKLPSEEEICKQFDISRTTARKAYARLEYEGLLYKRAGKGTYVSPPKIEGGFSFLRGFEEKITSKGLDVSTTVLSTRTMKASKRYQRYLSLSDRDEVYELKRLRFIQGEPIVIHITYVAKKMFPNLLEKDLTGSITKIFRDQFNVRITNYKAMIEPILAGQYESSLLNISEGAPMLLLESIGYSQEMTPVRYSRGFYHTGKLSFYFDNFDVEEGISLKVRKGLANSERYELEEIEWKTT